MPKGSCACGQAQHEYTGEPAAVVCRAFTNREIQATDGVVGRLPLQAMPEVCRYERLDECYGEGGPSMMNDALPLSPDVMVNDDLTQPAVHEAIWLAHAMEACRRQWKASGVQQLR